MSEPKRATRVGERVREELMEMLLRGEIHDPGVAEAFVSDVRVTDDLRLARVYLRCAETELDEPRKAAVVSGFRRAHGHIRRLLGQRLQLKYTPELSFFWDEGIDHSLRVQALLHEIRDGESPPDEAPE